MQTAHLHITCSTLNAGVTGLFSSVNINGALIIRMNVDYMGVLSCFQWLPWPFLKRPSDTDDLYHSCLSHRCAAVPFEQAEALKVSLEETCIFIAHN